MRTAGVLPALVLFFLGTGLATAGMPNHVGEFIVSTKTDHDFLGWVRQASLESKSIIQPPSWLAEFNYIEMYGLMVSCWQPQGDTRHRCSIELKPTGQWNSKVEAGAAYEFPIQPSVPLSMSLCDWVERNAQSNQTTNRTLRVDLSGVTFMCAQTVEEKLRTCKVLGTRAK